MAAPSGWSTPATPPYTSRNAIEPSGGSLRARFGPGLVARDALLDDDPRASHFRNAQALARADASYTVIAGYNAPSPNMDKGITVDLTTLTNVGFTCELTAGAEAGDIMTFIVHDV